MSNVQGLTAALVLKRDVSDSYDTTYIDDELALKANQSDVLSIYNGSAFSQITQLTMYNSNVSISGTSAFVTPDAIEVYNGSSWLASRAFKFTNSSVISQSGSTPVHLEVKATPALADISDITAVAQNVSFGRPVTHVLANDPGFGTEAAFQYIITSTMAHQISARFDNTSNTNNYIRWYVRDANGTLQNAFQQRNNRWTLGRVRRWYSNCNKSCF